MTFFGDPVLFPERGEPSPPTWRSFPRVEGSEVDWGGGGLSPGALHLVKELFIYLTSPFFPLHDSDRIPGSGELFPPPPVSGYFSLSANRLPSPRTLDFRFEIPLARWLSYCDVYKGEQEVRFFPPSAVRVKPSSFRVPL